MDLTTVNSIAGILSIPIGIIGLLIAYRSSQRGTDVVRRIIHVSQFEASPVDEVLPEPMTRADAFELEKRYRRGDFLPIIVFIDQYKQMRLYSWMLTILGAFGVVWQSILVPFPMAFLLKAIFGGAFIFGICALNIAEKRLERRFPR